MEEALDRPVKEMQKDSEINKKEKEKRANMSSLFSRIHSALICSQRGKYNLVAKPKSKAAMSSTKSGTNPRQTFLPPTDEKFYFALFREGLLKENIIIKESSCKSRSSPPFVVFIKFDHPVINICTGFTNTELRPDCRSVKYRYDVKGDTFDTEIDGMCRIQVGINRVLFGRNYSSNVSRYDGYPTAMWFDVYDAAIEQFLLMKFRTKRVKSIFTKRRRNDRLIRPPTNPPFTMGDVMTHHNVIGPRFFEQQRETRQQRVLIAVMTHRIGELGERQRVNRFNMSIDPVLPFQNTYERGMNEALSRRRRTLPSLQRSESNTDQFESNARSNTSLNHIEEPEASRDNILPLNRRLIF